MWINQDIFLDKNVFEEMRKKFRIYKFEPEKLSFYKNFYKWIERLIFNKLNIKKLNLQEVFLAHKFE